MNEAWLRELANHPDYLISKRVPTVHQARTNTDEKYFIATIIDLETLLTTSVENHCNLYGLILFETSFLR